MKIVIDIPDEVYNFTIQRGHLPYGVNIAGCIIDGALLPKGHDRLIAEPTEMDISNTVGGNNDFAECIRDSVKAVFENAPTIIEADKEAKNEDSN